MLIHTVGNKHTRPKCFKCFVQPMPTKCDHFKTEWIYKKYWNSNKKCEKCIDRYLTETLVSLCHIYQMILLSMITLRGFHRMWIVEWTNQLYEHLITYT